MNVVDIQRLRRDCRKPLINWDALIGILICMGCGVLIIRLIWWLI